MGWKQSENDEWTYFDENGTQKIGWFQDNDGAYYYLYSDDLQTGWFRDFADGNWYYFSPCMQVIDGKQFYRGQMIHGVWLLDKGKWYYFNEVSGYGGWYKGQMIHSCTYTIPQGKTYTFNDDGSMINNNIITREQLNKIGWYNKYITDSMLKDLNNCLKRFNITTPERIRHFISQCSHESGCGYYMTEAASGRAYEYRSDLGNVYAGDGVRFKGAGYIQLTGRANYQAFSNYIGDANVMQGASYVANKYPWTSAGFWWYKNNMNFLCDNGADCLAVTKRVNGGTNGYTDRLMYYNRCCNIFR